ncbi:VOC family protein [Bacillus weihaiensis]|uniref:Glyoxalase n=1 Tax=Bacillus weihaiensis TaxID=1547283 RepID=A0A1L3MN11_9BACI|nr:VOC family protein [Bacillus weihaiensis]APH03701.1 glyoxalase [Bacillus weihaiensis]
MINRLGQVMLYVNDQDQSKEFWTKVIGFQVISEVKNEQGMSWIEMAPTNESETSIILHDKETVAKMSPDLHLGTPSLMFFTENLEALHNKLSQSHITVGEIVTMPTGKVFNFADYEGNYFAVMEK